MDVRRYTRAFLPVLLLCVLYALVGCGSKKVDETAVPVPLPPDVKAAEAHQDGAEIVVPNLQPGEGASAPQEVAQVERENSQGEISGPAPQVAPVQQAPTAQIPPKEKADTPRDERGAMEALLREKGQDAKATAVSLLRPSAIREAGQLVAIQTAVAWRYKQLLTETEAHADALDMAFNFAPLMMTQGQAMIMPPVLSRAGASLRIEAGEAATAAQTSYELLAPARFVAVVPTWRTFLLADAFPEPERPNPALLPTNSKERAIWEDAVREGWAQGVAEAESLYRDNIARMVRDYRGIMLYHLLTAQHLLTKVNTASADRGMVTSDKGNKLHIGQMVYRITTPAAFAPVGAKLAIPKRHRR